MVEEKTLVVEEKTTVVEAKGLQGDLTASQEDNQCRLQSEGGDICDNMKNHQSFVCGNWPLWR